MELRLMYWKYQNIMVTSRGNEVKPMSPVHPFRILKGELEARGIKQKDFAERLGMKPSNFSRMINSDAELTPSLAIKLENELGIPYIHWMRMMGAYYKDMENLYEQITSTYPEKAG